MKRTSYFLLLLSVIILIPGCSNDSSGTPSDFTPSLTQTAKKINIPELNLKISINEGRLVFESQSAFDAAVKALEEYEKTNLGSKLRSALQADGYITPVTKQDFTFETSGFLSLYDDFTTAMNEAENYYDTEEGYKQFKEKHSALFFAEQPEDYSAYLPVSNKSVAKFLNAKGEVEIAGEVKDIRDITSYKQLIDNGLVTAESELVNLRSTVNRLDEVKCNDRKLWVIVSTRPGTSLGVYEEVVVEVCFRKKGFLGIWYNYSSETTLGWAPPSTGQWPKSGYSSHDYIWPRGHGAAPFQGRMWVQFRGFGEECGDTKYYFDVNK
ncbi:MAG: hypothetical protein LBU37_03995 [Tannerellaceae bacterium]|jgi:hypothetical protein|nr:hypothetical protein [Tannerellaceae bacterium]